MTGLFQKTRELVDDCDSFLAFAVVHGVITSRFNAIPGDNEVKKMVTLSRQAQNVRKLCIERGHYDEASMTKAAGLNAFYGCKHPTECFKLLHPALVTRLDQFCNATDQRQAPAPIGVGAAPAPVARPESGLQIVAQF